MLSVTVILTILNVTVTCANVKILSTLIAIAMCSGRFPNKYYWNSPKRQYDVKSPHNAKWENA